MVGLQPFPQFDDLLEHFDQFHTELPLEFAGDADMLSGLSSTDFKALLIIGTFWVLYQVEES